MIHEKLDREAFAILLKCAFLEHVVHILSMEHVITYKIVNHVSFTVPYTLHFPTSPHNRQGHRH